LKLRVLHTIYDDARNPWVGGGGSARVHELYRRLKDDVAATVLTGNYPGAAGIVADGVRYERAGVRKPYALTRLTFGAAATRRLRSGDYDVAAFDFSAYTPILVPVDRPVGIVVHHLTAPTATERWGKIGGAVVAAAERTMLERGRRFSATSHATLVALEALLPGKPIDLVTAGVPDELFELERRPAGYALYLGRLDVFHKGLDVLLEASALLAGRGTPVDLRIAGRGGGEAELTRRIGELGIQRHVSLLGAVSVAERNDLFAGASIFVMPSRFEGFGIAAAEAMAAGVPVVASNVPALREVVDPPAGGVVVPPRDAEALAAAIAELMSHSEALARISLTARSSAERFRWQHIARDHLKFLHAVAEMRRGK
jgi:glycogen(starch) synthase